MHINGLPLEPCLFLGHSLTHFISALKLFFLTLVELGAHLSSFLEEVLYKYLNELMNEYGRGMVERHVNRRGVY